jgi:hypothetical protein
MRTFAQLTRPDGRPVLIRQDQVTSIYESHEGMYAPEAHAVIIFTNGTFQAVKETPDEVVKALS